VKFLVILSTTIVAMVLAVFAAPENGPKFEVYLTAIGTGISYFLALRLEDIPAGLRLRSLLCSTIYRWRNIRVSVSYLVRVKVDDHYLLVRGHRIPTQFQPVGGVYKVQQDVLKKLQEKYRVTPDKRFVRDDDDAEDLRLMIPGRFVASFLRWIRRRQEVETPPWREFYEELIRPGYLDADTFATPHFEFVKTYAAPLRFDRYSDHQQLLIYDVFDLHPTHAQVTELRRLSSGNRDSNGIEPGQPLAFFSHLRLAEPASPAEASAEYEIAAHARWIISSRASDS
jgi:hypothetical protein